jgi:S-adenosylmethionine:tRNA ribosyltransferase-isomerase
VLDQRTLTLPPERRAGLPAELRGGRRDQARLLVIDRAARTLAHSRLDGLGEFLQPGDLLVFNTSRTLPAALPARRENGEAVELRPCVRRGESWDVLAVQPSPPHENVPLREGERLSLDRASAIVEGRRPDIPLLWRLRLDRSALDLILRVGHPIRYSYVPDAVPLEYYQSIFATQSGSAESPSAGRAFTWELILALRRRGVQTAGVLLHTGLSSFQDDAFDAEHHLFEEWFAIGRATADAVRSARRVIAVGTTVVRALETAATGPRAVRVMEGWTDLRIGSGAQLQAVQGLITGFHEPQASHFDLLRAFLDEPLLARAYAQAIEHGYLWHEFGDLTLII